MSPRVVRRGAILLCAAGVAGMIVAAVADSTAGALTAGLSAAAAALALILVTAVTGPAAPVPSALDESLAREVEERIRALAAAGADEDELRALTAAATRLARRRQGSTVPTDRRAE